MPYFFLETGCLEITTKFEFQKFGELIVKSNQNLNIHVKLTILSTKNKTINYLKQKVYDFKIQLARKIRADFSSLYGNMSSFGAPDIYIYIYIYYMSV